MINIVSASVYRVLTHELYTLAYKRVPLRHIDGVLKLVSLTLLQSLSPHRLRLTAGGAQHCFK